DKDDDTSFMAFLEEVKKNYQNSDPQLYTTLNKFAKHYNVAKSKSISRLSSFLYDINCNIDPMARVKSGVPIRVQVESVKRRKANRHDTKRKLHGKENKDFQTMPARKKRKANKKDHNL
ncbi:30589_t:CDS:1, partial [Racocetra persica]